MGKSPKTKPSASGHSKVAKTAEPAASGYQRLDGICDSVLDVIGNTPLVRLQRIGANLPCEILVKCEYFNAGGSVKDRIGRQMVADAEAAGTIQPGDTLIEPTSGNTGIGLAMAAAVKGYKCVITMPEKMSKEKVDVLKALGAEIVRTPNEAAFDAPDSHISVAKRLQADTPRAHILDQYSNLSNPNAHYHGTAEEIIRQCSGGTIDMLVAGAGTGGTITGIARRLKEHNPKIKIVGVDPEGSILALPDSKNDKKRLQQYQVEGIGYDFIPNVLNRDLVDTWYKSNDATSLVMMRQLIRDEGLLCGGSSGAAVAAALQACRDAGLKQGQRCVVILPDSVRNYMTKALSDDWMLDHGFADGDVIKAKSYATNWWSTKRVYEMPQLTTPLTITYDVLCKDAIQLLKNEGFDMVPVLDDVGHVIGVVTEGNMTQRILTGRCSPDTTVQAANVIYKTFHKFNMHDTLGDLARALDHDPFVLIVTEQRCFSAKHVGKKRKMSDVTDSASIDTITPVSTSSNTTVPAAASQHVVTRSVVSAIVSRIDLLDFISSGDTNNV